MPPGVYLTGLDCEAPEFPLPGDNGYGNTECDNYLDLLHAGGAGTNQLNEIEVTGDDDRFLFAAQRVRDPESVRYHGQNCSYADRE